MVTDLYVVSVRLLARIEPIVSMARVVRAPIMLAACLQVKNLSDKTGRKWFISRRKSERRRVLLCRGVIAVPTGEDHICVPIIIRGLVLKAVISWHEARSPAGLAV
jgi:hypothetical protein